MIRKANSAPILNSLRVISQTPITIVAMLESSPRNGQCSDSFSGDFEFEIFTNKAAVAILKGPACF